MHSSNKITKENVDSVFSYRPPKPGQPERYQAVRGKAGELAHVILDNVPDCADRSAALRLLREVVMTANAGIALEE